MTSEGAGARTAPAGRILVLHDNAERGETLARMLRMAGHTVTVVGEGAAAPAAVIATLPDLVLAAPYFEDPPLVELVRGVRWNLGHDLPVLLVAGREDPTFPEMADDVVREPVDPHELARRVSTMLRQRFARQALQRRIDELQGLYRVSWAFSLAGGAESFFGQLAKHSAGLVHARRALVLLHDPLR
ncbi:MAG TPA: hypothetical protein VFO85_10115, partial [Vicinamibacteria bacterium]|nr:hypothetical protein [Vicinamibacteria bacterium]